MDEYYSCVGSDVIQQIGANTSEEPATSIFRTKEYAAWDTGRERGEARTALKSASMKPRYSMS
jgi:hypothetical protein